MRTAVSNEKLRKGVANLPLFQLQATVVVDGAGFRER